MLLRQAGRKLGLTEQAARSLTDPLRKASCQHALLTLVRQRVYALALGYKHLNDHDELRAETFVDSSRFRGTCYRAAGWERVGLTRGYARSGGGWVAHGEPKTVWLRPLAPDAAALRAFRSPTTGRLTPPSRASMHRLLSDIDPGALDRAV